MTTEQQDLAWACLPKEARDYISEEYINAPNSEWHKGYISALENIFGSHNLTSDTEPEEMLMVSKKQVMTELCRAANLQNDREEDWIRAGEEIEFTLTQLFGDKCLPEKEEPKPKFKAGDEVWYGVNKCTINKIEGNTAYIVYNNGASWENISQLRPYIEPNYKFGIGEKVKFRNSKIKIVRRRFASPYDNEAHYSVETLDGQSPINVVESDLEPYTEEPFKMKTLNESLPEAQQIIDENFWDLCSIEENKETMELSDVKNKIDEYFDTHTEEEVYDALKRNGAIKETMERVNIGTLIKYNGDYYKIIGHDEVGYNVKVIVPTDDDYATHISYEAPFEITAEPEEPMEEKELNLCELLKDCEGETFYSDVFELVILTKVNLVGNFLTINWNRLELNLYSNGSKVKGNRCVLWPSKELYEKYPLDAYSAWIEWKESRKPKQWKPSFGDEYFAINGCAKVIKLKYIDNFIDMELDRIHNRFRTKEEAHIAAKIVREVLQKFYEKKL